MALGQAAIALVLIVVAGRLALRPLFQLVARTRSTELFMAACLLVIVGTALTAAASGLSMTLGAFVAGLLLDLAPPADHVVGQWALAFVVAAALAGRVRSEVRDSPLAVVGLVAVCSFVATSLFALTGLVLGDLALPPGQLLQVVLIALLWDVVVAPVVVPLLLPVFERPVSHELAA